MLYAFTLCTCFDGFFFLLVRVHLPLFLQVWVAYQLSRLKRGDDAGAREVLQRSLQSLAKHKHVSVISR